MTSSVHTSADIPQDPARLTARYEAACLLRQQGQYPQAIHQLRSVLRSAPQHTGALLELGGVLMLQGRVDLARQCYVRLLRLQPRHPLALYNLGQALEELGRAEDALQAYAAALVINPHTIELLYPLEYLRLSLCDWQDYDARMTRLQGGVSAHLGQPEARPLAPLRLLSFPMPLALHRQLAQQWSDAISQQAIGHPIAPVQSKPAPLISRRPIRVGYLSADFRDHPMGGLVHAVFAHHRRPQFEVFAYSLAPADVSDAITRAIASGVDHFCCVASDSPHGIAERIRADGIDVLIDLMGHTHLSRPAVLALRAAPVQLLYLGYPGPMGADFIDGVIADVHLIPPHLESGYLEPVYRLPCAFVASPPLAPAPSADAACLASPALSRAALGLPAQGVVYASFNRAHKLDPHTFSVWLQILSQVPGSVLWLVQASPLVQQRLRSYALAQGVDAARLVFTQPVASADFARLCALADLMLDTAHYGSGATGVAALRAGLALLTCPGQTFASRMGASLCAACGLEALICESPSAYLAKAVALGRNPKMLAHYRTVLLKGGDKWPLFDTAAWVQQLEELLGRLVNQAQVE